jgi:hypothetical protein
MRVADQTIPGFLRLVLSAFLIFVSAACWSNPTWAPVVGAGGDAATETDAYLALLGAVSPATLAAPGSAAPPGPLLVFRTASNYFGDMEDGGGGVAGADAICQQEAAAFGYAGTYRALLGTERAAATPRFACMNANCSPQDPGDGTNWVLGALRDYYRAEDNAYIGTTTADRIFTFPLANSFANSGSALWHWGGIHSSWRPMSGVGGVGFASSDFNGWTGQTGGGWIAYSHVTTAQAITTATVAAFNNTNLHLVCVQQ